MSTDTHVTGALPRHADTMPNQDMPHAADYGPPYPAPAGREPPMRASRVPWKPWVVVLVTLCVLAALMMVGAFAVWLFLWAHVDG